MNTEADMPQQRTSRLPCLATTLLIAQFAATVGFADALDYSLCTQPTDAVAWQVWDDGMITVVDPAGDACAFGSTGSVGDAGFGDALGGIMRKVDTDLHRRLNGMEGVDPLFDVAGGSTGWYLHHHDRVDRHAWGVERDASGHFTGILMVVLGREDAHQTASVEPDSRLFDLAAATASGGDESVMLAGMAGDDLGFMGGMFPARISLTEPGVSERVSLMQAENAALLIVGVSQ